MTRILLLLNLLSSSAFPQNVGSGQPWDRLFGEAWIAQTNGEFAKFRDLKVAAWALVSAAGPFAFGYADGVEQAYATTIVVSGQLPASRFYTEALKATEPPSLVGVRVQILIHQAFRYSHHQEVAANSAYEEALSLIDSMQTPPGYFAQMLRDFADLKLRMGDPENADKLLARAALAPSFSAIPYPRFGMQDLPTGISGYNPAVKTQVEEVARLVREAQYERAGVAADQAFLAIEALPRKERYFEDDHFESIAGSYIAKGRKTDAAVVLERAIATSKQFWGSEHHEFARTLERVAWRYFVDLRMLGRAHELIDQAAQIISASDGDTSDAMSFIEHSRLRLAEFEGNSQAVIALKDKIRGIWVAVHGANTKPIVIH